VLKISDILMEMLHEDRTESYIVIYNTFNLSMCVDEF
jgi:hypothetical protein